MKNSSQVNLQSNIYRLREKKENSKFIWIYLIYLKERMAKIWKYKSYMYIIDHFNHRCNNNIHYNFMHVGPQCESLNINKINK